ncbi:uncharacterized protein LOC135494323 [Lineus longissimus]|uniref:uncharacterized protein LOC135494323 n=1 Tax=Lineus longissimus TaxID=88925 RepID=UPI00315CB1FF
MAELRCRARHAVLRVIQHAHYGEEIQKLKKNQTVSKTSRIRNLCPYLENGLLRVGGRLEKSTLPHEGKHPVILPGKERLVWKLIRRTHVMEGHVGRDHVTSTLRMEYWIVGVITAAKNALKHCVPCAKYQASMMSQKMGSLPMDRISATRSFECVGVDYFGPLYVVVSRRQYKLYGVLFSCNFTRAIHLEVARQMNTPSCLLAVSRFMNRRGSKHSSGKEN